MMGLQKSPLCLPNDKEAETMTKERAFTILQTTIGLIFLSLGTIFTKIALSEVTPLTFTWVSIAIGMTTLSFYTFVIRKERIPKEMSKQIWLYIIAIGFFNFAVGRITMTISLSLMPATTNTYITNFIGFITMAMSIFILKESPTVFQVLGALVAFSGLRVFFNVLPPPKELMGVVFTVIGITGVAFTNNIARKLAIVTKNELSNNIVSTLALLIGGSIAVVVGIILGWPPHIEGWKNWAVLLYAGVYQTAFFLTFWNYILRILRSYEASVLGASTVIWTALLAVLILGEVLTVNKIIGICLMFLGLALVQIRRGKFSRLFRTRKIEVADVKPETGV
jgi:O-acetylserine/cysteine efflux transporter